MPHELRPERLLAAILETSEDAVLSVGLDGAILSWSRGAQRLYGYAPSEIVGQSSQQLMPIYEITGFEEMLERAERGEGLGVEVVERLHRDGTRLRMTVRRTAIAGEGGEIASVLEAGRLLEWSGSDVPADVQLRMVAEQMPGLVWTADRNLKITSNWGAGLPGSKVRPGTLAGNSVGEFLKAADPYSSPLVQHHEALRGTASHFEYQRNLHTLEIRVAPLRSGGGEITGCIGVATDITDRKKTEEQIRHQATHDGLTGLANYREFMDTLEREVRRADRSHQRFTVLMLDLDDLKIINDRLGHLAGNRALKRVATVMKEQCRATDLVARYGGDEFAVVLIDSDTGMAEHVASRIEASLRKEDQEPRLSASIGVGVFPDDGRTAQDLLQAADRLLYQRKKAPRTAKSLVVR